MTDEKKQAVVALKTCRGQLDGIIKMIEDERYCIDVSNQILAAQSMLRRANKLILAGHINSCVRRAIESGEDIQVKTDELTDLISKLLD